MSVFRKNMVCDEPDDVPVCPHCIEEECICEDEKGTENMDGDQVEHSA